MKQFLSSLGKTSLVVFSIQAFSETPVFYRYKVQKNDTLGNILSRWGACPLWGTNGSVEKAWKLNRELLDKFNNEILVDSVIKLPPTTHPERVLPPSGSLISLPQDLPELCLVPSAVDVVAQNTSSQQENVYSLEAVAPPPKFKKEQLRNALLVISTSTTLLKTQDSSLTIEEGTPLLVLTQNGDELQNNTLWVELPSGEKGEISRKDVALFSSEGYINKYQRQSRETWNGFIEPVGFVANKPLRLGGGINISKALWKNGVLGTKETFLALSANILQTIKASQIQQKPFSSHLSADIYFRLGANGFFMIGPSMGYVFSKNSPYSQSSFPSLSLKGRILFNSSLGLYGELSSYGINPIHSVYAVGGVSFSY